MHAVEGWEYEHRINIRTRITTFIKTKFKKSDDQTNIDKYRVAANITEFIFYQNGRKDFLVTIIELIHFLNCT